MHKTKHPTIAPSNWPAAVNRSRSYLVRLVAQVAAEGLGPAVCAFVFVQQGGAGEHLATGGTLVELLRVDLLDVLAMLLQRGEAQATLLTVARLRQI